MHYGCEGYDPLIWEGRSEAELAVNIKKATSPDETAPKRKHVRSCIVYTWDHKSSQSFWAGMKVCVMPLVYASPLSYRPSLYTIP
jgi:hypothetical protein